LVTTTQRRHLHRWIGLNTALWVVAFGSWYGGLPVAFQKFFVAFIIPGFLGVAAMFVTFVEDEALATTLLIGGLAILIAVAFITYTLSLEFKAAREDSDTRNLSFHQATLDEIIVGDDSDIEEWPDEADDYDRYEQGERDMEEDFESIMPRLMGSGRAEVDDDDDGSGDDDEGAAAPNSSQPSRNSTPSKLLARMFSFGSKPTDASPRKKGKKSALAPSIKRKANLGPPSPTVSSPQSSKVTDGEVWRLTSI
jgi:hypothetical protein